MKTALRCGLTRRNGSGSEEEDDGYLKGADTCLAHRADTSHHKTTEG